jgi:hypothetical protein
MEGVGARMREHSGRRRFLVGGAALVAGSASVVGAETSAAASPDRGALQRLLDENAIKQLSVNYALATDMIGRGLTAEGLALYRATFTSDAEITSGAGTFIGPEAWADFVHNALQQFSATQHLIGTINVVFARRSDRAEMSTYLYATHEYSPGGNILAVNTTYFDDVGRTRDGWRITKKVLELTVLELREHL